MVIGMFIYWKQTEKGPYAILLHKFRKNGQPRSKHIASLGLNPAVKLRKLIREGRLTEEQAAKITVRDNGSDSARELREVVEEIRKGMEPFYCEKLRDYCKFKREALRHE